MIGRRRVSVRQQSRGGVRDRALIGLMGYSFGLPGTNLFKLFPPALGIMSRRSLKRSPWRPSAPRRGRTDLTWDIKSGCLATDRPSGAYGAAAAALGRFLGH
jgi:hypothetical protein